MQFNRGRKFEQGNTLGTPKRRFRCVYCKRLVRDREALPSHEAQCDARFVVRRMWAQVIERAYRRESAQP